jgi:nucleotide-binding universal stress UspA family protein
MESAHLMPEILAFSSGPDDESAVRAVTTALARTLHLTSGHQHSLPAGDGKASAAVLLAMEQPSVGLTVLPYHPGDADRLINEVIRHCSKPVVLTPVNQGVTAHELISRVLVPLDGTSESADTVAETVALFAASGADIIALHVFDQTTVPKFWDQAAHARKSWDEEFLARNCHQPDARLELRSGMPGENILDVAATEHADLIALGWTQNLSPGRAETVRTIVAQTSTPILLLPVAGAESVDGHWLSRPAEPARQP